MDIQKELGKRICFLRKQRKMSQEDLALEANVNRNYLCDLENGRRNPSLAIINKICKALRVPISYLFKGIGENNNFFTIQ